MTYAIISILVTTSIVWLIKRTFKFEICPVCAGVFLTWLWILIGMFLGKLSVISYQLPVAILMGGTVVGLMSKLEKFIKSNVLLIWKVIFVSLGFLAVYGLIISNWLIFALGVILAITAIFIFKTYQAPEPESKQAKELEERMKKCC